MPFGLRLNVESFVTLTRSVPNVAEMQAALDGQDMLARLVLSSDRPIEVASDSPPEYLWRGQLGELDVSFYIGVVESRRLPGAEDHPDVVRQWPLALWAVNSGQPEDLAGITAGAMALQAWEAVGRGSDYNYKSGAFSNRYGRKRFVDFMIAGELRMASAFHERYPEWPLDDGFRGGGELEITATVSGGPDRSAPDSPAR